MDGSEFKRRLKTALRSVGFLPAGSSLTRSSETVQTTISFQKSHGDQWYVNVGFWLFGLGREVPARVEKMHLSFRLERLVPEYREVILLAGALEETESEQASEKLVSLLPDSIDPALRALGTEVGLRKALAKGQLEQGLILREARAYLSS